MDIMIESFEAKIQQLIDDRDFETAQQLVDRECTKLSASSNNYWNRALHELRARILNARDPVDDKMIQIELEHCKIKRRKKDDKPKSLVDKDKEYEFLFVDTHLILGSLLLREGHFHEALEAVKCCGEVTSDGYDPKVFNRFQVLIKKIEHEQELQRKTVEKELEEELLVEEKKSTENRKKKGRKQQKKALSNKAVEPEINQLNELSKHTEDEVPKDTKDEDAYIPRKFHVEFYITMDVRVGPECHIGSMVSNVSDSTLPKSFVNATMLHVKQLEDLVELCSRHESLLRVEGVVQNTLEHTSKLLVTEVVYNVGAFFVEEFKLWSKTSHILSKEEWWKHIQLLFWTIFRDICRGLMFLFKSNKVCGDLSFFAFVTLSGRGRILPSLDPKQKAIDDVKQLKNLMLSAVFFKFLEEKDDLSFLPSDLTHFLKFNGVDQALVPPITLVDHVYFLTKGERVDFALKLKKLLQENCDLKDEMNGQLMTHHYFEKWFRVLNNDVNSVYYRIFSRGGNTVLPYDKNISIVRFFRAVYAHANENEYKQYRPKKRLDNEEIEKDLSNLFPDFYKIMFECFCKSVKAGVVHNEDFKAISSCYFRDEGVKVEVVSLLGKFMTVRSRFECSRSKGDLKLLYDMAQCITGGKQIMLHMEKEILGNEISSYIGKEEIEHFAEKKMIGACQITLYIRLLYHECAQKGMASRFGFLCPHTISKEGGLSQESRAQYILDVFIVKSLENKLFLSPYCFGLHWVLCAVDPFNNKVYYLDSIGGPIEKDIRETIDLAFNMFHSAQDSTGKLPINDPNWIQIQCPLQRSGTECGYFVLKFMRDIIEHGQSVIPTMYFPSPTCTLDQVREEWSNYLLKHANSQE